jgi:hypothetical protein
MWKFENVLLSVSKTVGLMENAQDEKLVSLSVFDKHLARYAQKHMQVLHIKSSLNICELDKNPNGCPVYRTILKYRT